MALATERFHTEQLLRESEGYLRSIVSYLVDGLVTVDNELRITSFTPAAEKIFGYTAAEVSGLSVDLLVPPDQNKSENLLFNIAMADSDKVLDHYQNPRNVGKCNAEDGNVGTGMVGAPACGDVMRLQIQVSDDGVIEDAKFKTYGCGSAIASSSLLTEWVKGRTLDDAEAIKNTEIAEELALPPVKIHCSVLAEDAIKAAIRDIRDKRGEAPESTGA